MSAFVLYWSLERVHFNILGKEQLKNILMANITQQKNFMFTIFSQQIINNRLLQIVIGGAKKYCRDRFKL